MLRSRTGTKVKKLRSSISIFILLSPKCDALGFDNHGYSWLMIQIIFIFISHNFFIFFLVKISHYMKSISHIQVIELLLAMTTVIYYHNLFCFNYIFVRWFQYYFTLSLVTSIHLNTIHKDIWSVTKN